jgi:chromosome segregation ATPase
MSDREDDNQAIGGSNPPRSTIQTRHKKMDELSRRVDSLYKDNIDLVTELDNLKTQITQQQQPADLQQQVTDIQQRIEEIAIPQEEIIHQFPETLARVQELEEGIKTAKSLAGSAIMTDHNDTKFLPIFDGFKTPDSGFWFKK